MSKLDYSGTPKNRLSVPSMAQLCRRNRGLFPCLKRHRHAPPLTLYTLHFIYSVVYIADLGTQYADYTRHLSLPAGMGTVESRAAMGEGYSHTRAFPSGYQPSYAHHMPVSQPTSISIPSGGHSYAPGPSYQTAAPAAMPAETPAASLAPCPFKLASCGVILTPAAGNVALHPFPDEPHVLRAP